jgi:hypothetical protein
VFISEGGNIFKQQDGTELTRRINQNEVAPTINWLESITGLDLTKEKAKDGLPAKWLGSTGRKSTSGDLDLAVNANEVSKAELESKLKSWATQNNLDPKDFVKKSGISVHFATPIEGNFEKGFVQTDFMFLNNLEWETWLLSGGMRSPSEYKGVFREVALNSVAKGTITSEHPQGLRLSGKGVVDRATGELVTLDPEVATKLLFGKDGTLDDMSSVENIYKKLKNDPNKQQKLKDFEEYAARSGITPPKFNDTANESAYDIITKFRNLVVENSFITEEAKGPRIPHPEDAIFDGGDSAKQYLNALKQAISSPESGSIKWDGGIALYFGNLPDGRFVVTDKYMPNKGVYPTSPEEWVEYDQQRGANRNDLYEKIDLLWPGLKQAVSGTTGLFKSDLMAINPKPQNGYFVFKPVTVEYRIPVESDLGKQLQGKVGFLIVHEFDNKPWRGEPAMNKSNVALIPASAGVTFNIKPPAKLINDAESVLSTNSKVIDDFLSGLSSVAREALKKYMNHKITKQTNDKLVPWLSQNISKSQYNFLVGTDGTGYLQQNAEGLNALVKVWNAIYKLKVNVSNQLENQVQGFEQSSGGQKGGEGFVFPTDSGLVKIVDRQRFGAAHFNK